MVSSDKYDLSDSKAAAYSSPQTKTFTPLRVWRKGRICSSDNKMNLSNAPNLPVSLCTSLVNCGGCIDCFYFVRVGFDSFV